MCALVLKYYKHTHTYIGIVRIRVSFAVLPVLFNDAIVVSPARCVLGQVDALIAGSLVRRFY